MSRVWTRTNEIFCKALRNRARTHAWSVLKLSCGASSVLFRSKTILDALLKAGLTAGESCASCVQNSRQSDVRNSSKCGKTCWPNCASCDDTFGPLPGSHWWRKVGAGRQVTICVYMGFCVLLLSARRTNKSTTGGKQWCSLARRQQWQPAK